MFSVILEKQVIIIYDRKYDEEPRVQRNILQLKKIIRENSRKRSKTIVSFQFNGYGSDKQLHETNVMSSLLPLQVCHAYQNYYLIGLFPGKEKPYHFRIDLITKLQKKSDQKIEGVYSQAGIDKVQDHTYLASHRYMYYERPEDPVRKVTLRIKHFTQADANLTLLHDAFGNEWTSLTHTADYDDVLVECVPSAIQVFVRQYLDRVRVLEPEDVKKRVEDGLREEFKNYLGNL